jgi:hypothetical protein
VARALELVGRGKDTKEQHIPSECKLKAVEWVQKIAATEKVGIIAN